MNIIEMRNLVVTSTRKKVIFSLREKLCQGLEKESAAPALIKEQL